MKIGLMGLILFLCFCACSKKEGPNPEILRLQTHLAEMQTEYAGYEDKIRTSNADLGLKQKYIDDRELLSSRIERTKDQLKALGVEPAPAGGKSE